MAITSRKITTYAKNIVDLSDTPNKDGITAAQLKAMFDGRTDEEIKTSINGIVDDLTATTDGASGADQVGATAVGDGTAVTVQGILEEQDAKSDTIDGLVVHKADAETITGVKTFSVSPIVPAPTTGTQASTKKYVDDTDGARKTYVDNLDALAVHLAGNETITGIKTFSASPVVPAPTTDTQAATKKYVDDADALKVDITDIVNDLTTGGTAVPLSAEQGKTLQGEVGTLASLSTTEKGSLVGAINEVDDHADTNATSIGTLASLTTTEKTNLVGAINELDTDVGTNATAIGTLASLTTTEKTNLVGAINELDTDKVETSAITNTLTETGTGKVLDARQGKTLSDKIGAQTYTEDNYVTDAESATASIDALDMAVKDNADLISTNTADIGELEVKSSDTTSKISAIENTLINLNPDQTARVNVESGARIVSLPKTAGQGGLLSNIKGMTLTNLITNGDFSGGLTGWTFGSAIVDEAVVEGELTFTGKGSPSSSGSYWINTSASVFSSFTDKYYVSATVRATNSSDTTRFYIANGYNIQKTSIATLAPANCSVVFVPTNLNGDKDKLVIASSDGTETKVSKIIVVDLTTVFGAGNEPTASEMDLLTANWFDGTKSVVAPRVKSVGKNLFNGVKILGTVIASNGVETSTINGFVTKDFIPINPTNNYYGMCNISGSDYEHKVAFYDINKIYISSRNTYSHQHELASANIPSNARYIRVSLYKASGYTDQNSVLYQFEVGLVTTTYEPYTESKLYIEPKTLRRATTGEVDSIENDKFIQRVAGDYTKLATPIVTENVTSGTLLSNPSGSIILEPALADAGMYSTNITILRTGFPIKTLESIYKVNLDTGEQTELAVASATIAGDGLSFTHTGLVAGDIVFFTYFYDEVGVYGENIFSYYDSRYVIVDSVTGKFYKWNLSLANGIPSINLVEVV